MTLLRKCATAWVAVAGRNTVGAAQPTGSASKETPVRRSEARDLGSNRSLAAAAPPDLSTL